MREAGRIMAKHLVAHCILLHCPAEDEKRLRAAGFVPVLRWLDYVMDPRTDQALKTVEALTILDRREESAKKKAAK